MAGGLGGLGYLGLGKETSGGVAVSPQVYFQGLSESVKAEFDRYDLHNITGRLAPPDDRAGVLRVTGDVVAHVDPVAHGHVFVNAFGAASTVTSLGASLWRHKWISPTASQWDTRYAIQPYTYEIFRDVGSAQQYDGCNVSQIEFTLQPNAALQCKASLIATAWRNIAASTASFQTTADIFDFTTASLTLGGAANAEVEAFTLTYDNQLEGIPTMWGRDVVRKIRRTGPPAMTISATIGFEDITELERYRQQSETAIDIVLKKSTANEIFQLTLPRIVWTAFPTGMGGRGRQTVDISGMARYHQGSGTAFQVQLTNGVGSY